MVDEGSLEIIKERVDIVEVISNYIKLKKKGVNYSGLCPFHNEKTPSFVVSPEKKIFHCFGCGAGGNVFTFLMKIDGYTFVDSVKYLAEKCGIEINDKEMINFKKDDRELGFDLLSKFKKIYHSNINSKEAKEFFKQRKISLDIIETFQLGYSSQSLCENNLKDINISFTAQDFVDIGIGIETNSGLRDRFYKRIIFPIIDLQGRTLAFGGRIISGEGAKYVNSPETRFYKKSNVVYGLNLAKQYIREHNSTLILVEGYMDVISLFQAGIRNVSAVLGTAITNQQVNQIKRFVKTLFLCFDNDSAGKKAMFRINDVIQDSDIDVMVINLKDTKDPDEFINKYGIEDFKKNITLAITYKEFLIDYLIGTYSAGDDVKAMRVEDKSRVLKELKNIMKFDDEIIKNEYIALIASKLCLDIDQVKSYFFTYNSIPSFKKREWTSKKNGNDKNFKLEEDILSILLNHISLREDFLKKFSLDDFSEIEHKKIYQIIKEQPDKDIQHFCEVINTQKIASICMKDNFINPKQFLNEAHLYIQKKNIKNKANKLKNEIIVLEKSGDFDKIMKLNRELSELVKNK
jgi:DNA primase